ncbi:MAG: hypothetical protein OSB09_00905 [Planctomycetota bacterium]|nr:hypothetical protein [Planctomycetota bacterium]
MIQEIWQKNRKVLIQVLSALAIFLVATNVTSSYRADHEKNLIRHEEDAQLVAQDLEGLEGVVDVERKSRTALEDRNLDLLKKLGISFSAIHQPSVDEASVSTDFKRAKDLVWNNFRDQANRAGMVTPAEIPNFDERSDLSLLEWADRYRLLEVLDRFTRVCLQTGVARLDDVIPAKRLQEALEDPNKVLARYPLHVKMLCKPEQLVEMLLRFQRDGGFLSLEPTRVTQEKSGGEKIEVDLLVVGIDMEDPRVDSGSTRRGSDRSRRGF